MLDIHAPRSASLCCGPKGSSRKCSVTSDVGGSKPAGRKPCGASFVPSPVARRVLIVLLTAWSGATPSTSAIHDVEFLVCSRARSWYALASYHARALAKSGKAMMTILSIHGPSQTSGGDPGTSQYPPKLDMVDSSRAVHSRRSSLAAVSVRKPMAYPGLELSAIGDVLSVFVVSGIFP